MVAALVLGLVAVSAVVWSFMSVSTQAATQQCGKPDEVDIYLHDDADLPGVRDRVLAAHQDVASVVAQTKQQSYVEFTHLFADQPDLLKTSRPEAMPALVKVWPKAGVPASALADALTREFPAPAKIERLICHELQTSH